MSNFYLPLFIFIYGVALLSDVDGARIRDKTITMAKLNRELRREYRDFYEYHALSLFLIHSFGDRLYNVTDEVQISPECSKTAKVAITMTMQLSIGVEMDNVLTTAVTDSMKDFQNDKQSKHVVEFICHHLDKAIAEKPNLAAAREKALKNLMPGFSGGGRPPYSQELFTELKKIALFVLKKLTVPDIARYICNEEVQHQLEENTAYSTRTLLFVKTLVAVAEKERFGQIVQSTYEKSLDEIVPRISANVRLDSLLLADDKTFWFLPELLKIFYKNVAKDAVLKAEIEETAAVLGKDADKADLDFSRI